MSGDGHQFFDDDVVFKLINWGLNILDQGRDSFVADRLFLPLTRTSKSDEEKINGNFFDESTDSFGFQL